MVDTFSFPTASWFSWWCVGFKWQSGTGFDSHWCTFLFPFYLLRLLFLSRCFFTMCLFQVLMYVQYIIVKLTLSSFQSCPKRWMLWFCPSSRGFTFPWTAMGGDAEIEERVGKYFLFALPSKSSGLISMFWGCSAKVEAEVWTHPLLQWGPLSACVSVCLSICRQGGGKSRNREERRKKKQTTPSCLFSQSFPAYEESPLKCFIKQMKIIPVCSEYHETMAWSSYTSPNLPFLLSFDSFSPYYIY